MLKFTTNDYIIITLIFSTSRAMLSLGASKPWPDALEILTGSREIDASAMVNYFKPLIDWLDIENEKNDEVCGWGHEAKKCEKFTAKKT